MATHTGNMALDNMPVLFDKIVGSTSLKAYTNSRLDVNIRHLVLDGSSQWVIGKNLTRQSDILHANKIALKFKAHENTEYFTLTKHNILSYMPISAFDVGKYNKKPSVLSYLNGNVNTDMPRDRSKQSLARFTVMYADVHPSRTCSFS